MVSIVLAFDKFKGSLTAKEACIFVKKGIISSNPDILCQIQPMADGGEGSLDVLRNHLNLCEVKVQVADPLGRRITASYGLIENEAFIETSACCGLQLLTPNEQNPMFTNTYGVGQMIADAIKKKCDTIHLFVGGSATTDGGAGMAAALGLVFLDKNGKSFIPNGKTLTQIAIIDGSNKHKSLSSVKFFVWTDVNVPLFGPAGSACMFSGQKGANPDEIKLLDHGLRNIDNAYACISANKNISELPGSGAAGGLAAGCIAFLNAKLGSGIDYFIKKTNLEASIKNADYVITGEGSIDDQSVDGKVISGIASLVHLNNKKLILVGGRIAISEKKLSALKPDFIYAIQKADISLESAMQNAGHSIYEIGKEIGKIWSLMHQDCKHQ